jgi:oligopeptide transport system substrate-binding protein
MKQSPLMHAISSKIVSVLVLAVLLSLSSQFVAAGAPSVVPGAGSVRLADGTTVITAANQPSDATPKGDQTLRLAGPTEGPDSLDPALSRDLSSAFLVRQIFRGLTRLDKDLNAVPELADRIEISSDELTYTFHLRANATFQSGRQINADDVVFSLSRAVNPATADGNADLLGGPTFLSDIVGFGEVLSGASDTLTGVMALDASTVQITLAAPRSTFLMKLASAPASIVDPDDVASNADWWQSPNGSGPFSIASWKPDDDMVLARYDEFFAGAPALKKVDIRLGPNALQSFNLYQADQIDLDSVSIDGVDRVLAPEAGLSDQVSVTPLFAVDFIAFRTDVKPLDDPWIRKALQLAFPRDDVADISYDGHVEKANGLIPDGMLGQDWPVAWPAVDVDAAKAAIAKSSYGSADKVPPIQLYISGYTGAESLRDSIRASIGLNLEVIDVEWNDFMAGMSSKSFPGYELYWGADYPDPESLLETLFGTGRPDNYVGYSNPKFDALMAQAAVEQDPTARAALYAQAQQLLVDDAVIIPLYYDVAYTLQKPDVKGLEMTALGILRLDSVWLEH